MAREGFISEIVLRRERIEDETVWPFQLPIVRSLKALPLHPKVTYMVGENGSGKSTLLEAVAICAGFSAEGGTKNMSFQTREESCPLADALFLKRNPARREEGGFFLRAESFFNVATYIDDLGYSGSYGGRSLHSRSHGEAFLALSRYRYQANWLYLFDEPESALSPQRQLGLLRNIHTLADQEGCQFIIATHSPVLMAYPDSTLYEIQDGRFERKDWRETEHYQVTKSFLEYPEAYLRRLMSES